MRVTLSPLITDARGLIGNSVFSVAKSGQHYVRMKAPIAANPRSSYQQVLRCSIVYLANQWRNVMDAASKALWEEFAQKQQGNRTDADQGGGKYNLIPRSKPYSGGWQAFIGINTRIRMCGSEIDDYTAIPPTGPQPWNVVDLTAVWDAINDEIDFTWDDALLDATFSSPVLRIWIESYEGGAHKQLVVCEGVTSQAVSVSNVRYALGILGPIVNHPGLYRIQCDVLELAFDNVSVGLVSPPSQILEIIAS